MLDKPGGMVYHTDRPQKRTAPAVMNDMGVYRNTLAEYGKHFDEIEFAVCCRGYENRNYEAFRRILRQ